MARAGYSDIRTADETLWCSSCDDNIQPGEEYARDRWGMQICERCLEILEDEGE